MKTILITGAGGFIGSALYPKLISGKTNIVIAVECKEKPGNLDHILWEQTDLTDWDAVSSICQTHSPDVVIHCAGIAHQKIGAVDSATYMRVNSEATVRLAKMAAATNPSVHFIFLSSISVYGEENLMMPVSEEHECHPSSDYAVSKLDAEKRLIALTDKEKLQNLIILRLAPVYDRDWTFNLDRRILAPKRVAYLRFGSGLQKMSALARPNLIEFVEFLLQISSQTSGVTILNVCDAQPYEFNTIIRTFQKSGIRPNRPAIPVPMPFVWLATRIAGCILRDKKKWLHSCYDKLASSLIFDHGKMLKIGFKPVHSLKTIFSPEK